MEQEQEPAQAQEQKQEQEPAQAQEQGPEQEQETESSRSAGASESSVDPWVFGGVLAGGVVAFLLIDRFILPWWQERQAAMKALSEGYYDDQASAEQARFMRQQLLADKYRVM